MTNHQKLNKQALFNGLTFFLILLMSVVVFILPDMHTQLEFNRLLVEQHEYYRLLSSSIVHNNIHHLWLNVAGGLLLFMLFYEHFTPLNQIIVFVFCSLSVGIGIYYFSTFNIYMGLSGYLHGIFAWAVLKDILADRKSAWLLAVGGIIKLIHEHYAEAPLPQDSLIGIAVATDAHVFGVISGIVLCLLSVTKMRCSASS